MPKAKPKTERSCLVCDTQFLGTPSATRCDPCKEAGHKVPREKQQERRRKPLVIDPDREAKRLEKAAQRQQRAAERQAQVVTKVCLGCGDQYEATRSNSRRCPSCVESDVRLRSRSCIECGSSFPSADPAHVRCQPCADLLGLDQFEMTQAQIEAIREEERKVRWKTQLELQRRWLDQREKAPKGYEKMTKAMTKTPLGVLWLELCHADGAAASVMHTTESQLSEDQKLHLLTSYFRLRVKGYHPSALAKLCPQALLDNVTSEDLEEMPEVTESEPEDDDRFDPLGDLSPEMRAEVIEFQAQQDRHIERLNLGLAS